MPTAQEKIKKLQDLLKMIDESITRKEFVASFENVIKVIKKAEADLGIKIDAKTMKAIQSLEDLQETHRQVIGRIEEDNKVGISNIKKWALNKVNELFAKSMIKEKIKEIDTKLSQLRDGKDGKDADQEIIVGKVLEMIPPPEAPEVTTEIVSELQEDIKELEEEIEELKQRELRRPLGGGGTNDAGVKMALTRLIHTETPVGDIDGANKAYTTNLSIGAVISFAINGMVIHDDEYTVSTNTITFTTALPSALSGKSFKIVYV